MQPENLARSSAATFAGASSRPAVPGPPIAWSACAPPKASDRAAESAEVGKGLEAGRDIIVNRPAG
ncbi:hypothetical protein [Streptomyces sp. CBMAI 2042]|uniref:hypothetical protein n=1 Tax=Streptomyces sp. CBMAI 2042 TaxID=2305222 RepID=UPI001F25C323|nr:hypothetical protein [Streptomyces sp. CBMAI 2042]